MTVSQRLSKWVFYLLMLPITLGFFGWQGWQWWSWASAPVAGRSTSPPPTSATDGNPPDAPPEAAAIEVPSGATAKQIGADLESAGLIRSATAWNLWTRWRSLQDRSGSYQAGIYQLSPTEPLSSIAAKIWQGDVVEQSFTIPEGWSIAQMAEFFEAEEFFSAAEFVAATETIPRDRYPWLPPSLPKLEGFLYPDTYRVPEGITPEGVVNQMLERFEQIALPLHQPEQSSYSLQEWVTLASIVEKEAVVQEERPLIASVFARRLREGIPLGADPTVEYGLGIRQTVDNPLTYDQVAIPSPYNTYINAGLPPTPISNPGVASLEASLKPEDTAYLFFMARYDGTHIFSRTVQEHEAAKAAVDRELSEPEDEDAASPSASPSTSPPPSPSSPSSPPIN